MIDWRFHHKESTVSTNLDARAGSHGDVYTADYQSAGRGRLDHKWVSPPKTNLLMSVVLSVEGLAPETVATLPLVIGLAVVRAVGRDARLKWPNDVLVGGKKVAGILCERQGDNVIVGIGVNVGQQTFPPEIAIGADFLGSVPREKVRDEVLENIAFLYEKWRGSGFTSVHGEISAVDWLKGRELCVRQTDDDTNPVVGVSGGIRSDGSLDVGGVAVYAGEAHVMRVGRNDET